MNTVAPMLHAHLTTLHVVSQILEIFAAQPELTEPLLAGSGITVADLACADTRCGYAVTWVLS